jgi:hypothetical protein
MKTRTKNRRTIPLLALQVAIFNAFPSPAHKAAVANLRASLADKLYRASQPKTKERL